MAKKYYWTRAEEANLLELWKKGITDPRLLSQKLNRKLGAIKKKLERLGVVVVQRNIHKTTTSVALSKNLLTREEALKILAGALELLSRVGLNDAFLFVRRFSQLSDGQRYRYRIAKMIESGARFWVMDEFCATLDRDTAKIVAFNVQRLARKLGRAVIAATTHTDLFEDFAPSVHIHKRFGREISVKYYPGQERKQCSLLKQMRVEEGSYEDWKEVAGFHYRSHRVAFMQKIFVLKRRGRVCGAIVYTSPSATAPCRSQVFKPKSIEELNEKVARIARVVVHPKYRTIGAGVKLLHDSLPSCSKPYVEMIAVMARYNPFAEHAGMKKICESKPDKTILKAMAELEKSGFTSYLLAVPEYNKRMLKGRISQVKEILSSFSYPYTRRIAGQHGHFTGEDYRKWLQQTDTEDLARGLRRLAQLNQSKVYLFWKRCACSSRNQRKVAGVR